jgi:phytoene synthase
MAEPGHTAHLASLVRENDRPRYYATLFAPAALRPDLFALYGFAAEIARITDQVSEPTLGEIRLQWWREQLESVTAGQGADAPALAAIGATIARHKLPKDSLTAMIEARRADLYADPPAKLSDVEGFLGETQSAQFQLAALICGSRGPETAEAAGHAGVAYGLARRLARFAHDRARGRTILPLDLLAMEGLAAPDVFATPAPDGLEGVIQAMTTLGRHHLRLAHMHLASIPRVALAAFLPLAGTEALLDRVDRAGARLVETPVGLPDLAVMTRIGWARLLGRI